jgi:hypothetical protein
MRFRLTALSLTLQLSWAAASSTEHEARAADKTAKTAAALCGNRPVAAAVAAASPYDDDPLQQRRKEARVPKDQCEVADNNLRRAMDAILAAPAPAAFSKTPAAWNHRATPLHFEHVRARLAVSEDERTRLFRNGFVVLNRPVWQRAGSFARLFHDIYQAELPLYVSADAILHAVYASNDALIKDLEEHSLRPLLTQALGALYCALPAAAPRYGKEVARDLDLYLTVAQSLLLGERVASQLGDGSEVAALLSRIKQGESLATVPLFGRERVVDFSQFTPRGHYAAPATTDAGTAGPDLSAYFRAAMWLSRVEWNLISRSCRSSHPGLSRDPSETPREAQDALALADLAQRSGALPALEKLDTAWQLLAGPREDVSVAELLALQAKNAATGIATPQAAAALRQAIGAGYVRSVRQHYMPPGSTELPVIATLLGARVAADAQVSRPLVHSEVPERFLLQGLDLGYALGHDRAKAHLGAELTRFPTLAAQLERARTLMQRQPGSGDLYSAWLRGVRGLAAPLQGATPSFMTTAAFADLRLNSAIAGLGQLRHNYVLMAAQSYSEGGCHIPDAYLDPAVPVYDGLLEYAERGTKALEKLDPQDRTGGRAYFTQLKKSLQVLRAIAIAELSNQPLSDAARRFLGMVAEMTPESTGSAPTWTGWYFDLYRHRQEEALTEASFISDVFTAGDGSGIAYLGAQQPAIGLFVVDTGGPPRLMVGPVATAFQAHGKMAPRYADSQVDQAPHERPWAASYTAAAPAEPSLSIFGHICATDEMDGGAATAGVVTLTAQEEIGPVTVELLDHNYGRLSAATQRVGRGKTVYKLMPSGKKRELVKGIGLRAGGFSIRWMRAAMSCGIDESYGKLRSPGRN